MLLKLAAIVCRKSDVAIVQPDEVEAYQASMDSWEVVPMGPLFGQDLLPKGSIRAAERELLIDHAGLKPKLLKRMTPGRRALCGCVQRR